ncbi:MAG: hypothetical protein ACRC5M_04870 [Anaeroplasmataceae bacterium]
MKEEIVIYSLLKELGEDLPTNKTVNGKIFNLTNIRALVLHQDTKVNREIGEITDELIATNQNPYHFAIDINGDIFQLNPIERCLFHLKSKKYTKKANEYFGDLICPLFEETVETPHPESSPDNCTISILLPKASEDGAIGVAASKSAEKLCAYIINKYAKALQAQSNILCANDISEVFNDRFQCFRRDPSLATEFKYSIERLRSSWFVKYGGFKRGYCDEKIIDVEKK